MLVSACPQTTFIVEEREFPFVMRYSGTHSPRVHLIAPHPANFSAAPEPELTVCVQRQAGQMGELWQLANLRSTEILTFMPDTSAGHSSQFKQLAIIDNQQSVCRRRDHALMLYHRERLAVGSHRPKSPPREYIDIAPCTDPEPTGRVFNHIADPGVFQTIG